MKTPLENPCQFDDQVECNKFQCLANSAAGAEAALAKAKLFRQIEKGAKPGRPDLRSREAAETAEAIGRKIEMMLTCAAERCEINR
jgi:hypothetical protein